MKAAHRVEIGRERVAVSRLKLFNQALDVGCDDLLCGLLLLRLFGVLSGSGDGGGGDYVVHGCFLLGLGCCFSCHAWHVPTCRTPPGEGGAARRNEEGYRPPEGEAQRSDFSQKNYGETSCAAPGQRPQRGLVSLFACVSTPYFQGAALRAGHEPAGPDEAYGVVMKNRAMLQRLLAMNIEAMRRGGPKTRRTASPQAGRSSQIPDRSGSC